MVTKIDISTPKQVMKEYLDLQEKYKYLLWTPVENGYCIKGTITASAQHGNVTLQIEYQVRIDVPMDYPRHIPICYEIGKNIVSAYHQYPDGRLCLGVDTNQYIKFRANQCLLGYIEDLLIPYLFGYEYFIKFGMSVPWSEEKHNAPGLIDFYKQYFGNIGNVSQLLYLLMYTLSMRNVYLPNNPCPCGIGKHIKLCHIVKVLQLRRLCIYDILLRDVYVILDYSLKDVTMLSASESSKLIIIKQIIEEKKLNS